MIRNLLISAISAEIEKEKCLSVLCALSERSERAVNKDALLGPY